MLRMLKAAGLISLVLTVLSAVPAAAAGGDLLVAPTRLVLDGSRGTEVVLNNIGAEPATYRISLEIKRMTAEGGLAEVDEADATPQEKAALGMIAFSPRRVTLPPNQPQVIRALFYALERISSVEHSLPRPKMTLEEKQQANLDKGVPLNAGLPWTDALDCSGWQ